MPLPGSTIRKIACDANIHRVITDGLGSILDYGRSTRTIPPAVYTSLVLRDWGCRFPGCDRPAEWCEGHHVWHWEDGGPTNLSNLVLLCSKHHHVIHLPDWHLSSNPTAPSRSPTPKAAAAPATHPAPPQPPDRLRRKQRRVASQISLWALAGPGRAAIGATAVVWAGLVRPSTREPE